MGFFWLVVAAAGAYMVAPGWSVVIVSLAMLYITINYEPEPKEEIIDGPKIKVVE